MGCQPHGANRRPPWEQPNQSCKMIWYYLIHVLNSLDLTIFSHLFQDRAVLAIRNPANGVGAGKPASARSFDQTRTVTPSLPLTFQAALKWSSKLTIDKVKLNVLCLRFAMTVFRGHVRLTAMSLLRDGKWNDTMSPCPRWVWLFHTCFKLVYIFTAFEILRYVAGITLTYSLNPPPSKLRGATRRKF